MDTPKLLQGLKRVAFVNFVLLDFLLQVEILIKKLCFNIAPGSLGEMLQTWTLSEFLRDIFRLYQSLIFAQWETPLFSEIIKLSKLKWLQWSGVVEHMSLRLIILCMDSQLIARTAFIRTSQIYFLVDGQPITDNSTFISLFFVIYFAR